jgi:hypothetical protein
LRPGAKQTLCKEESELMKRLLLPFTVLIAMVGVVHAQNWPQFRGPGATGVTEGLAKPSSLTQRLRRTSVGKLRFPGLSHASPVVWGNKVFVVTAVSTAKDETRFGLYGDVAPVKDDPKHSWKIYALDKSNGKILWERVAYEGHSQN